MRRAYLNQFHNFELGFDLPKDWHDESWGNDVCPSFIANGYKIYVDYLQPERREMGEDALRFHVYPVDSEERFTVLATNDIEKVLAFLSGAYTPERCRRGTGYMIGGWQYVSFGHYYSARNPSF